MWSKPDHRSRSASAAASTRSEGPVVSEHHVAFVLEAGLVNGDQSVSFKLSQAVSPLHQLSKLLPVAGVCVAQVAFRAAAGATPRDCEQSLVPTPAVGHVHQR